jgi:hypothetical protein
MATVIPSTGTMVSMGRIGSALGLYASGSNPTASLGLNSVLGLNRGRNLSGQPNKTAGSQTIESSDFGGLSGSGTY